MNGNEGPSGFGFELTFRLKREQGETNPPTWPATLMQALARYVFQTGIYFEFLSRLRRKSRKARHRDSVSGRGRGVHNCKSF